MKRLLCLSLGIVISAALFGCQCAPKTEPKITESPQALIHSVQDSGTNDTIREVGSLIVIIPAYLLFIYATFRAGGHPDDMTNNSAPKTTDDQRRLNEWLYSGNRS